MENKSENGDRLLKTKEKIKEKSKGFGGDEVKAEESEKKGMWRRETEEKQRKGKEKSPCLGTWWQNVD